MAVIFEENAETIGVGKSKHEYLEVLIGEDNLSSLITDEDSGIPITKSWVTGATVDNPFGLVLVSIALMFDQHGAGAGVYYYGGYALVNDVDAESGEGINRPANWKAENIAVLNQSIDIRESGLLGAPTYEFFDFNSRLKQRVYVAPSLPLELTHYINASNILDDVHVTAKFTFRKVKMTKTAYLEKLALRAYG